MPDLFWEALVLLLLAFVVLEAVVLVGVMRQVGGVIVQLRPARIGELADEGPEPGKEVSIPGLSAGRAAVLLFIAPGCSICRPLLPSIPAFARANRELDVLAVIIGSDEATRAAYAAPLAPYARLDLGHLETEWGVPGTPFVVGVTRDHRVARSGVANSLDQLDSLALELLLEGVAEAAGDENGADPSTNLAPQSTPQPV